MYNFFEDCKCGLCPCLYRHKPPILLVPLGAKYEQKLEPLLLNFTTDGAIVTRCTTKYTYFNIKLNEEPVIIFKFL